MGDSALIGGGSGGWLHLDFASEAVGEQYVNAPGTFAPITNTTTTASPGASTGTSSILYLGLFALGILFFVRELS
jgi:hypothetical protein